MLIKFTLQKRLKLILLFQLKSAENFDDLCCADSATCFQSCHP